MRYILNQKAFSHIRSQKNGRRRLLGVKKLLLFPATKRKGMMLGRKRFQYDKDRSPFFDVKQKTDTFFKCFVMF